jgi:CheY-like chemotaxis protein
VRQAGGTAWLETAPGEGTKVHLLLPRQAEPTDQTSDEAAPPPPPRRGRGQTVLVVDDEPSLRTVLAEALDSAGYRVLEAADGPGGLGLLGGDCSVDLMICDLGLPGELNGRQLFDAARQSRPEMRVLFITGFPADETNTLLDPDMPRLVKPFPLDSLTRAVGQILEC